MNNRYKKYSIIIFTLPFFAWTTAYFTQPYRYSDYRKIYLGGVIVIYSCWIIAVIWGLLNAIEIFREDSKKKEKIAFIFISLFPLLLILSVLISIPFL